MLLSFVLPIRLAQTMVGLNLSPFLLWFDLQLAARPSGPGFKLSGGGGSSWYTTDVNPFKTEARVKPEIDLIN